MILQSKKASSEFYDLDEVKRAASGQWASLLPHLTGVSSDYFNGRHGPCPIPGCPSGPGKDRWHILKDFDQSGGCICNQCGAIPDGLGVVEKLLGITFLEALEKVAQCVGVSPKKRTKSSNATEKTDPTKNLKFANAFPILIAKIWAKSKPPVAAESLQLVGTRYGMYRKQNPVFALPAIGQDGTPCGWFVTHATAKQLPIFEKGNKEPVEWRSSTCTAGSQAGWLGPIQSDQHEIIWKVEGPSDMLALLTLGLPANHTVCTNLFGAKEDPASNPWMLERFRGKTVYVLHDCDIPGQDGAMEVSSGNNKRPGWAPAIATVAKECCNVVLPFPIRETIGKDLRDWIGIRLSEGYKPFEAYNMLLEMAGRSETVEGQEIRKTVDEIDIELSRYAADDPHRLARVNLKNYQDKHNRTLRYWKQTWYRFRDGCYYALDEDYLFSRLMDSTEKELGRIWDLELKRYAKWVESDSYDKANDKGPPKQRKAKAQLVRDVVAATKGMCILPASQSMHDWISGDNDKKIDGHCVSVQNGILNITKAIAEPSPPAEEILLPHTPEWFSTTKLNFDFDPYAQCPNWIRFLHEVFNSDADSIEALQKWFGYLLTPDNSLQKILFVIGKKRSGKGTILQIMKSLLGEANIATPKLVDFAKDFGLESFANKSVGIIADARLSKRADDTRIMETLLSISGGDPQDIARKYKDTLSSVQLPIRFTVFSNEVPSLRDFSEAFSSRCVFLSMPNSYYGREDHGLQDRLKLELSGILNWAIIGRHKLNSSKRLLQPETGAIHSEALKSSVLQFWEKRVRPSESNRWIDLDVLFAEWTNWVNDRKLDCLGTIQTFSKRVRSIEPTFDPKQYRKVDGKISRKVFGIELVPEEEPEE